MSYEDQNGNSWSSWTKMLNECLVFFVLQRGRELMFNVFCPSKGTWACHQGHTHRTYFASLRPRFDRLIQSSARLHQSVRRFYCGATSLMGWVLPRNISAESLGKTVSAWWCSFDDAVLWSCQGARPGQWRTHITQRDVLSVGLFFYSSSSCCSNSRGKPSGKSSFTTRMRSLTRYLGGSERPHSQFSIVFC